MLFPVRLGWVLVAAALVVAAILVMPASPAVAASRPAIGIDGGWGWWSPGETAFRASLRIPWTRHEFCPGRCGADAYFAGAERAGTRTLCLLSDGQGQIPADPAPFAGWAAGFVRRYGPRAGGQCTWLEVLNEPYWTNFSGGRADPERYARLVRAVALATRRVDRGVRILAAADLTWAGTGPQDATPWIKPMARAVPKLSRYVDGVAVHPYTADDPRTCSSTQRWCFNRLLSIRRRLEAVGIHAPLWITEVGVATCPSGPSCQSLDEQRAWMEDMLAKASRWSWIKAVFIYQLRDQNTQDQSSFQYHYGLFTDDNRPKPAWEVVSRYVRGAGGG
jgi:Glycosyl hydrolase catalytic core